MRVYLDNAATTPLDPDVLDAMIPVMKSQFGNPSSIHSFGRESKALVENSRKSIARLLKVAPSELFFTSGGTEADNHAITCTVRDLKIRHVITSSIEHHAVLHSVETIEKEGMAKVSYVRLAEKGHIDLNHLEELLKQNKDSLVSLMHANNEIGNLLPIKDVGMLCRKYNAVFHSDTVQTIGHYDIDLEAIPVDLITCAAHKFHGPKGVGFLFIRNNLKINPLIYGGPQERNMRGGTENVYGIVGLSRAMEIAYHDLKAQQTRIQALKNYLMEQLEAFLPDVRYNGDARGSSLYTILNVQFPKNENSEMMLFNLDIQGVAASGGSACTSGSNQGSHVLRAIGSDPERASVRFSFSKYTTRNDIDYCVSRIRELFPVKAN